MEREEQKRQRINELEELKKKELEIIKIRFEVAEINKAANKKIAKEEKVGIEYF